jgi:aerobic carbon-monoxide dehydrogenase large subunit
MGSNGSSMEAHPSSKLVGAGVKRVEDRRLLTGAGRYVNDYQPDGLLQAAFLRSPYPHARIRLLDVSQARSLPGVVAVVTGEEMAQWVKPMRCLSVLAGYHPTSFPALAIGKVRHVGETVAVVVAESRYIAEDAVDRIVVDFEPLPTVSDVEKAIQPDAGLLHEEAPANVLVEREFKRGDVETAFRTAPVTLKQRFRFHRHAAVCMEPRGYLAEYNAQEQTLTLRSSTQCPGLVRNELALLLDLPGHSVRVIAGDVGGGFGAKSSVYPEELAVCALARELRRPVKWISDRREDLLSSCQAWDEIVDAELALDADGSIMALRADVLGDVGAYSVYPWTATIEPVQVISFLPGPYRVHNYYGRARGVATCKAPTGPYRGVGRPAAALAIEALMDEAASKLGIDPTELRLRNFIRREEFPYKSAPGIVWDRTGFTECMLKAREILDYESARAERARARDQGRWLGIGFASYVELTGIGSATPVSPGMRVPAGAEPATIRVDPSGTVTALFGVSSHGQGLETSLAQIVADELGAAMADVRVIQGDTGLAPYGSGTYASRSAVLAGGACILASRTLREKVCAIAAHLLAADPGSLTVRDSQVWVSEAPGRRVSFKDIANAAYSGTKRLPRGMEPGLEATRFHDPYYGTASSATHAVVVEVDLETYAVKILRYVVAEDCGNIINTMLVEGQVYGGVAQGIGATLLEEIVYDENAQLLTGTLMDYMLPSASDIPNVTTYHLDEPSPATLGGFRGMGEGGPIGAPAAIRNAIVDALSPLGIRLNEIPITPERIFRLVNDSAGSV